MEIIEDKEIKHKRFEDYEGLKISDNYYLHLNPLIQDLKVATEKYATGKVLDIACGNKPYEKMFYNCDTYFGCDIVQSSGEKVDLLCDASKIPLEDEEFHTVFSTQSIEHIRDYKAMLNEAYRLLIKGGYIILSGPMYWHIHEAPNDYYRFTKYGFKLILEESGFEIVEITPNGGKWAMFGQMVIHTFPQRLVKRKWFRKLNNKFFQWLDMRYFDDTNTMSYLAVARKN